MHLFIRGRCLLSNYFTGRDANRGACTHPCRWKYSIVEENQTGERLCRFAERKRGTYILILKDLCMIDTSMILMRNCDSLKIEGRMKTFLYVATVARTYRKAIDDYLKDPKIYKENGMVSEQIKAALTDSLPDFLWKAG